MSRDCRSPENMAYRATSRDYRLQSDVQRLHATKRRCYPTHTHTHTHSDTHAYTLSPQTRTHTVTHVHIIPTNTRAHTHTHIQAVTHMPSPQKHTHSLRPAIWAVTVGWSPRSIRFPTLGLLWAGSWNKTYCMSASYLDPFGLDLESMPSCSTLKRERERESERERERERQRQRESGWN